MTEGLWKFWQRFEGFNRWIRSFVFLKFSKHEQELRFVLPKDEVYTGTLYSVNIEGNIPVIHLDEFFDRNKR